MTWNKQAGAYGSDRMIECQDRGAKVQRMRQTETACSVTHTPSI
eukprot:CAMPEP_0180661752 /NCGR_PEP_ID=MMETSP1037_2-20121125/59013_1 /TAXON_ID=632150 /ORGANISM="Azadinium spinosum, Strain 3D9" /LENGTH=43 /DNA_ID= /DNA_START= /DNA_END= /DNA_ORIENTATION=